MTVSRDVVQALKAEHSPFVVGPVSPTNLESFDCSEQSWSTNVDRVNPLVRLIGSLRSLFCDEYPIDLRVDIEDCGKRLLSQMDVSVYIEVSNYPVLFHGFAATFGVYEKCDWRGRYSIVPGIPSKEILDEIEIDGIANREHQSPYFEPQLCR